MEERRPTADPERSAKKPYAAPSVAKVPLRPEEAVLGFCKNNTTAGPRGGNCRAVGVCSTQGT